jgi:hypothetical protein
MEQFVLSFDTRDSTACDAVEVDGTELMERYVAKGVVAFRVEWESSFVVQMAIEDDVVFICDAANELALLSESEPVHFVHLGDGELEVTAELVDGEVVARTVHVPGLEQDRQQEFIFNSKLSDYKSAWYRLVHQLVERVEKTDRPGGFCGGRA